MSILSIVFIIIGIASALYSALILKNGTTFDYIFTAWFWIASVFFGIQSVTYFLSFHRSVTEYTDTIHDSYVPGLRGKVAVLVPIFNEEEEMVITNLVAIYSNAGEDSDIYVLDDSTRGDSAPIIDLCRKLGMKYIHRENRSGYKAGALNNVLKTLEVPYVAVIDIDQTPAPDFLRETTALLAKDPKIGFIQVPQVYSNTDSSILAEIAQAQQFIFYDILTEGKSVAGTLFSCGTNVVYNLDALKSVGYFDENNIVEDIATSVNMAINGWTGVYYNKKLVFGRAPVTMQGYINQQWRWMYGSLSLMPKIVKKILLSKKFSPKQKLDWFATSTWYIFGWFYLIFLLSPILEIVGIRVLTINNLLYLLAWLPYTILLMTTFTLSQVSKKAPLRFVFYNMAANLLIFPLSISTSISVLLKKSKPFTTARTGGNIPLYRFWPQFTILILLPLAAIYLILQHNTFSYITAFWAFFQFTLLMPVFWLNKTPRASSMDDPAFKNSM
ncbi:glycosyltransferase [Ferroplasma acidiphilum]|jgi:cellulose synthase (UDP-forming)|uniref:Glycosyltransferase n=1 Tax=Ferroplasma acidiphilum TaxID=74969 RepID=A0A1V0N4C8_9ARCH|nr:glycosyltransferase family 2 protein [Ferroplasma acidiphilum]ARD84957.1 glycosyltransferase [Ferroplasma acidiphilum]MCL4348564.1 glycosyltransferase [Candidatus Thermoplasmatota archaeon]WMT53898.1 MAG: glycosyltransferase family 2 protein [Ferroplasma acidiphilum]